MIGFGTAKLHHNNSKNKMFKNLDIAYEHGFRHYDTSPYYGNGLNQYILYSWIIRNNIRNKITLTSKFGLYPPLYFNSKSFLTLYLSKLFSKAIDFKYSKNINIDFAINELIDYNKKFDIIPDYYLLHEPIIFSQNKNLNLTLKNFRKRLQVLDFKIKTGFSGKLYELNNDILVDDYIIQRPLSEGISDFNYECLSFGFKDIFYNLSKIFKNNENLHSTFLFSSLKEDRIKLFANFFK